MTKYQCISTQEAKALLEQGAQVADIRDPASFQSGHAPTAHNLSNENLQDFLTSADMDKPLLVFCYHGISSQQASDFLVDQGFDDVYSVNGGFEAWRTDFPALCETNA